eukprot:scaffold70765_cov37-Phaeocystis_antarctica.AAC.2
MTFHCSDANSSPTRPMPHPPAEEVGAHPHLEPAEAGAGCELLAQDRCSSTALRATAGCSARASELSNLAHACAQPAVAQSLGDARTRVRRFFQKTLPPRGVVTDVSLTLRLASTQCFRRRRA